jgi:Fic family protein
MFTGMKQALVNFQTSFLLNHEIANLIAEIDEFKGQWNVLQNLSPEKLKSLKHVATIESIGSSTRIEGVKLTDREIETLLSNLQTYSFKSRDEEEVAGYAEAMDLIFESWQEINLSENHLKQIHSVLLKFSSKDNSHRGKYKNFPNNVVAFDTFGNEIGVVFQTTSPFDTPFEMTTLISWFNQEREKNIIHPLLMIAVFVVCFLAIHPFQDGNGRLSRILTTLLLLKLGYLYVPYISLENIIEENKDLYYKALRQTQKTLQKKEIDWDKWILFFLKCLKKQKDNLSIKLEREKILAIKLPKLSNEILNLLKSHEKLNISEIKELTNSNQNTIKVRLRELVENNYIIRVGKGKATFYLLK